MSELQRMTRNIKVTERERESLRRMAQKIDRRKVPEKINVPIEYMIWKENATKGI